MWPFDSKKTQQSLTVLPFKDAEAAIVYAAEYMVCDWLPQTVLPAMVTKSGEGKNGLQFFSLKVPKGREIAEIPMAKALNENVPKIEEGDLVAFLIAEHHPELGKFGTIGFVVAKLQPKFDLKKSAWLNA